MQQITPDFMAGQLRVACVAILAYGGGRGWFTPADTTLALALMSSLGPLTIPWVWSIVSNLGTVRVQAAPTAPVAKVVAMLFIIGTMLAIFGIDKARASDSLPAMPAKAVPVQAFGTSGLYFGIYTEGGGGSVNASVAGVNTASLVTNQIGIGLAVGYAWSLQNAAFLAVEGMGKVNNVNGSQAGFSWNGPASFEERVKIGVPLDKVLAVIPNLGLPTAAPFPVLPQGTTLLNTKSYLFGAFHQDDNSYAVAGLPAFSAVKLSGGVGTGMIGQLSNGTALDAWAEVIFANSAHCFGAVRVCANEGNKYLAGLGVWF